MTIIQKLDLKDRAQINSFISFPYKIYANTPQWVPPFDTDIRLMLNKNKHPFYEHSDAVFFIALRDKEMVGRLAVIENRSFNTYHQTHQAQFYLFECEDNLETARLLFERAFEWAHLRNLDLLVGPKGFSAFDGYGVLTQGYEHRQMMNMMNYNPPYYPTLLEQLGFETEVDWLSFFTKADEFEMPDRVNQLVERVMKRGSFQVLNFRTKGEARKWGRRIGEAYNRSFVNNYEYYPLTDHEIDFIVENLMLVGVPRLIKVITRKDEVVGFAFGFPDVSAAMQRARGKLYPWNIADLVLELNRSKTISLNGAGVLPEFQGLGGNALMYVEMIKTIRQAGYKYIELTQNADTADMMRRDILRAGLKGYKNHRIYHRKI